MCTPSSSSCALLLRRHEIRVDVGLLGTPANGPKPVITKEQRLPFLLSSRCSVGLVDSIVAIVLYIAAVVLLHNTSYMAVHDSDVLQAKGVAFISLYSSLSSFLMLFLTPTMSITTSGSYTVCDICNWEF